jgi:hypothetical protein
MDSLCSKIAPKIMIFLYKFLLDRIGRIRNGFSFVVKRIKKVIALVLVDYF